MAISPFAFLIIALMLGIMVHMEIILPIFQVIFDCSVFLLSHKFAVMIVVVSATYQSYVQHCRGEYTKEYQLCKNTSRVPLAKALVKSISIASRMLLPGLGIMFVETLLWLHRYYLGDSTCCLHIGNCICYQKYILRENYEILQEQTERHTAVMGALTNHIDDINDANKNMEARYIVQSEELAAVYCKVNKFIHIEATNHALKNKIRALELEISCLQQNVFYGKAGEYCNECNKVTVMQQQEIEDPKDKLEEQTNKENVFGIESPVSSTQIDSLKLSHEKEKQKLHSHDQSLRQAHKAEKASLSTRIKVLKRDCTTVRHKLQEKINTIRRKLKNEQISHTSTKRHLNRTNDIALVELSKTVNERDIALQNSSITSEDLQQEVTYIRNTFEEYKLKKDLEVNRLKESVVNCAQKLNIPLNKSGTDLIQEYVDKLFIAVLFKQHVHKPTVMAPSASYPQHCILPPNSAAPAPIASSIDILVPQGVRPSKAALSVTTSSQFPFIPTGHNGQLPFVGSSTAFPPHTPPSTLLPTCLPNPLEVIPGTTDVPFTPWSEFSLGNVAVFQCITSQNHYLRFSTEELRLADYEAQNVRPQEKLPIRSASSSAVSTTDFTFVAPAGPMFPSESHRQRKSREEKLQAEKKMRDREEGKNEPQFDLMPPEIDQAAKQAVSNTITQSLDTSAMEHSPLAIVQNAQAVYSTAKNQPRLVTRNWRFSQYNLLVDAINEIKNRFSGYPELPKVQIERADVMCTFDNSKLANAIIIARKLIDDIMDIAGQDEDSDIKALLNEVNSILIDAIKARDWIDSRGD